MTDYPYQPNEREYASTITAYRDFVIAGAWSVRIEPDPLGDVNKRCCLCREPEGQPRSFWPRGLEPTDLPGTGYRCTDHEACARRVAGIVEAHKGLGEVCSERHSDGTNNTGVSHPVQSGPKVARNVIPGAKRGSQ